MTPDEREEVRHIIEDTLAAQLHKSTLPVCQIEGAKVDALRDIVLDLKKMVVGNGDITGSMLWKQEQHDERLKILGDILERRVKEKSPFEKTVFYVVDKILPSLLTTSILAFIGYQWLLIKLVTP